MVLSVTRVANATEGKIRIDDLVEDLVDSHRSAWGFINDSIFVTVSNNSSEIIQSKRLLSRVNEVKSLIDIFELEDRQNRSEDFISHHLAIKSGIQHDSWFYEVIFEVNTTPCYYLTLMIVLQVSSDSTGMLRGYDPAHILVFRNAFSIELFDCSFYDFNELIMNWLVNKGVVSSHTSLSTIEEFSWH